MQASLQRLGGGNHVAHIRVFGLAQGGGHADTDAVALGQYRIVRRGCQLAGLRCFAQRLESFGSALGRCAPANSPGPQGWIEGNSPTTGTDRDLAALVAFYTPKAGAEGVDVRIELGGRERVLCARPADGETVAQWRI